MIKRFLWVVFLFFGSAAYAQTNKSLGADGLKGEEILTLAACPSDESVLWVGTNAGAYERRDAEPTWRPVDKAFTEKAQVNQFLFSLSCANPMIATSKGLFALNPASGTLEKMFSRSDPAENYCSSVGRLKSGILFLGTQAGLFSKPESQAEWLKAVAPLDKEEIVSIYGDESNVYAATATSIYRSEDEGKTWEKIFNVYFYGDISQEVAGESSDPQATSDNLLPIRHITGAGHDSSSIYVATDRGVFLSKNKGKNWDRLTVSGLDSPQLRFLYVDPATKSLFAAAKSGLYRFNGSGWEQAGLAFDCRSVARGRQGLIFSTSKEVYLYFSDDESVDKDAERSRGATDQFQNEPSVRDVQRAAIKYGDVSNGKIDAWRRNARIKAFVPEVSLDVDKTVDTALGATYQRVQTGPQDWGVSLSWDLGDLLYSAEQTSIDNRSKLMVQLRNDILAEVTRLYFERRKLQIEMLSDKFSPGDSSVKRLRLEEITALLERLIGCSLKKVLKSNE